MATLTNTKIKDTYKSILKVSDNGNLEASLQEITDGEGNASGVQLNTGGDLTASGTVAFGSLKDSGENITITKFVDEADGIGSNDNDTSIPTSAAVKNYVDTNVTAQDLDFAGDSGTGAVDLDSQTFTIAGTANEIETSASGQTITIGLPSTITANVTGNVSGNLTGTVLTAAQTNITSVGTLSSLAVSGNLTVDTNTLFVDSTSNFIGIGTNTPSRELEITGAGNVFLKVTAQTDNDAAALELANTQETWTIVNEDQNDDALEFVGSTNGTALTIKKDGNVGIGVSPTTSQTRALHIGSSTGGAEVHITSTTGSLAGDGLSLIHNLNDSYFFNRENGTMQFGTNNTERMRIDSSGNVLIGKTLFSNSGTGVIIRKDELSGGNIRITRHNSLDGQTHVSFYTFGGSTIGSITTTTSATAYNTSSDYRLKENVVPMEGALDRVDALKPSRFNFIADPEKTVDGFLAHEVAEVIPEAITGEKDAVEEYEVTPAVLDEEGNVIEEAVMGTRPVYQGIDQSKIVPLLVGAIKELRAEIELLKAK